MNSYSLIKTTAAMLVTLAAGANAQSDFVLIDHGSESTVTSQADLTLAPFLHVAVDNLLLPGGTFGDPTTVNFNGGTITSADGVFDDVTLFVAGTSTANVNGTTVTQDILGFEEATINLIAGGTNDDLIVEDDATATISGGTVGDDVEAYHDSTVHIFGGNFGEDIEAFHDSEIFISGGTLGSSGGPFDSGFWAADDASITLFGSNFSIGGNSVGLGTLNYLTTGNSSLDINDEIVAGSLLSGTLADGSAFSMPFFIESDGIIQLAAVPEPSTYAGILGAFALLIAFGRNRKQS